MNQEAQQRNIEVKPSTLLNLIAGIEDGTFRIPQFQREYVWPKTKIRELFDSIYQEFPIGSFFFWVAGKEHNHLFRQIIELGIPQVGEHDNISFILDGQQRITSLFMALKGRTVNGIDYRHIVFDLKEQTFKDRTPDNKRYVSVSEIWGPNALQLVQEIDKEYLKAYERCWQVLRTYPTSVVEVRDKQLPDVCKIFQRINQSGKRLDRFDLISAMTFTANFDLREKFKSDILGPLDDKHFGSINPTIVTQLLALYCHGQCTERYEFSLTTEDIQNNWKSVVECVLLATDTLRKNMGVVNANYLPYAPFMTLLAYYFMRSGKRSLPQDHLDWIKQWFWRSSFSQHYGSGGPTKMGRDKQIFDKLIQGEHPSFDVSVHLSVDDLEKTKMTSSGSAIRNAFLCLLATQNPLHLENNQPLDLINNISDLTSNEKHHIFPKAFLDREGSGGAEIHAITNFCFLAADLNKRIRDKEPNKYIPDLRTKNSRFDDTAQTHLLPTGPASGIDNNDYGVFLKARGELILEEIGRLCGDISTPRQDERQQAIEKLETRLRNNIHQVLTTHFGANYWKQAVPPAVREPAQMRINTDLSNNPELDPVQLNAVRSKLDYINVSDYRTIVENNANWKYFEPIFRRKDDFCNYLAKFSEYRNTVVHSRQMTELVKINGEASIIWFDTVLSEDTEPQNNDKDTDQQTDDKDTEVRTKPWNEELFFTAFLESTSQEITTIARQIFDFMVEKDCRLAFGKGKITGSVYFMFDDVNGNNYSFAIWSDGKVEIPFGHLQKQPSFEALDRRLEMVNRINEIDNIYLDNNIESKFPSFQIKHLTTPEASEGFLQTASWVVETIKSHS